MTPGSYVDTTPKTFIAASSSSDSAYLLYKTLSETDDEIIARISLIEASGNEIDKSRQVCEWLSKNVRPFSYAIAEYEVLEGYGLENLPESKTYPRLTATMASLADYWKCDRILIGFNLHNWSPSNWFYQSDDQSTDNFYQKHPDNLAQYDHSIMREVTQLPVDWPFMWDKTCRDNALGRWQIWEALPEELKSVISLGCTHTLYKTTLTNKTCGKCGNCLSHKWYKYMKQEGFTAKQMDDLIMKKGQFGKYWTKDSSPKKRYEAYNELRATLLVLEE